MTPEYLAGFTDADGNFSICGRGPRISWGQKDPHVLYVIRDWLESQGIRTHWSKILPKPPRRPNTIYHLWIGRRLDCRRLAAILEPHLVAKPEQCAAMIRWMDEHPAKRHTEDIDRDEFARLIADRCTSDTIARHFKMGRNKVGKIAKALGLRIQKSGIVRDGRFVEPMTEAEWVEHRRRKEKTGSCVDCFAQIYPSHQRCKSCAQKHRHREKPLSFGMSAIRLARSAESRSEAPAGR